MVAQARRTPGKTAIQLRISLKDLTPTIWRRLVVPGECNLARLHSIFQAAMGWQNSHGHLFEIGDHIYAVSDDEEDQYEGIDENTVVLSEVLEVPMRFSYQYDFGDDWQHEVVVEAIESVPLALTFATCIDGQRACPPEDCGGTRGFETFVEAVTDPTHPEHDDYLQWLGRPFDAEAFSVAATNAALHRGALIGTPAQWMGVTTTI